MYCSNSWALFFPFSSSWNNKLGFRSLKVRRGFTCIHKAEGDTKQGIRQLVLCLYLLAQPVFVRGESPSAVAFIEHHQPAVNTVEQLQLFSLSVF